MQSRDGNGEAGVGAQTWVASHPPCTSAAAGAHARATRSHFTGALTTPPDGVQLPPLATEADTVTYSGSPLQTGGTAQVVESESAGCPQNVPLPQSFANEIV